MGFCSRSPCQNGGICFNVDADYECQCPIEFDGKNCQNIRDQCKEPNTQCKGKYQSLNLRRQKLKFDETKTVTSLAGHQGV